MSVDIDTSVRIIEGIGQAYEAKLHSVHAYTVSDLLRTSVEHLHRALDHEVPLATIRAWRNMAALMHVEEVDHQYAEALHRNGIETVEELARQPLSALTTCFAQAVAADLIPAEPNSEQVCAMIRDATAMHYGGRLAGTVLNTQQEPVPGAELKIGILSSKADARGRFRLSRIPLRRATRLVVRHPDYSIHTVDSPTVSVDDDTVQLTTVTLEPQATSPVRLSEYDGYRLPRLTDHAMTSRLATAARPPHHDLLVLHDFYADGDTAKLVSKYLRYEDGIFMVSYYRIPVSELPTNATKGSTFLVRDGHFEPISLTSSKLAKLKARRRAAKTFAHLPIPQTLAERDQRLADVAAFLKSDIGGTSPP